MIKNMKNAIFTKLEISKKRRRKKKDLKPKLRKLMSYGTALHEVHVTYVFFMVGMDIYQSPRF